MSSDTGVILYENDLYSNFQAEWGADHHYLEPVISDGGYYGDSGSFSINPAILVVVLAVVVVIVFTGITASLEHNSVAGKQSVETAVSTAVTQPKQVDVSISGDMLAFIAPYKEYTITQGPHGMDYGHYAIDIAAGRGAKIMSPINGTITQSYIDEYGNTRLYIENSVYTVILLHGKYSVLIGDEVKVGDIIGTESNIGYTMDMDGNLCFGRAWCGNHTHLNVFDKRLQSNINPSDLIN